jgi:hypothetical protein
MSKYIATIILTIIIFSAAYSQNRQALFCQTEYQFLKYNYWTVGFGFQRPKPLLQANRMNPKYSFFGWTVNYSKTLNNADWGVSVQSIAYTGCVDGPFGIGLEGNYKSVNSTDHYCFKPLIGLSFPVISIMYAYNFDFYKIKADRINQHEIILGIRVPLIRKK